MSCAGGRGLVQTLWALGLLVAVAILAPAHVRAAEVKVAVAANFTDPIKEIAQKFEKATGHKLVLSFGATGQFYAQIAQGAPFEVFLAADKATPAKTIAEGFAIKGTEFTYAVGRLVLYSKTVGFVKGEDTLKGAAFNKISIANPSAAPYGAAAIETMKTLGVYDALQPKIVQGQNIAQAYQFIDTGNAELGFVALAQVAQIEGGSRWVVPASLHAPILQDGVLLKPGEKNDAARALLAFLKGSEARGVIETFGYGID